MKSARNQSNPTGEQSAPIRYKSRAVRPRSFAQYGHLTSLNCESPHEHAHHEPRFSRRRRRSGLRSSQGRPPLHLDAGLSELTNTRLIPQSPLDPKPGYGYRIINIKDKAGVYHDVSEVHVALAPPPFMDAWDVNTPPDFGFVTR